MTDEPMTVLDAALLAYSQDELNAMDDSSLQMLDARVERELRSHPQRGATFRIGSRYARLDEHVAAPSTVASTSESSSF